MAEFSMWWTTGGAGDGAATYTRTDHALWSKVLASCNGLEGVAPNYLNKLAGTVTGANTVQINTGGALVDGKIYNNSAAVSVNIPSAVGGGNTRIDRIVLRADWTAQTVRITRIPGTDAASPTAPAKASSAGSSYDILLYQALVDTAGTVTLTDERTMAQIQTADIASNAVDNTKIRDSAALSVIGRGANSTGDPADLAAGTDGHVLRRAGTALAFGQVATGGIADLAVTSAKLAASAVIAGKIAAGGISAAAQFAAGVVDAAAIANRVRTFFVPIYPSDWTPSIVLQDNGLIMDASLASAIMRGYFKVPSDFVSGMTVSGVVVPGGTGNMYGFLSANYGADGELATTHTNTTGLIAEAVTLNQISVVYPLSLASAAAGDYVQIRFERRSTDPLDTVTADIYCRGIMVSYTADS
jgi:hypothetical protein